MRNIGIISLLVVSALFGYWLGYRHTPEVVTTEVVRVDTLVVERVEEREVVREVLRIDTIAIPVIEVEHDTVFLTLPIEQKVYADSLFRAVVSGYKPRLDSITIYPRTKYIERTAIRSPPKPFRFCVGAQVGYGFTPKGASPYAGLGISFGYTF